VHSATQGFQLATRISGGDFNGDGLADVAYDRMSAAPGEVHIHLSRDGAILDETPETILRYSIGAPSFG
jgi:hypothetical protein